MSSARNPKPKSDSMQCATGGSEDELWFLTTHCAFFAFCGPRHDHDDRDKNETTFVLHLYTYTRTRVHRSSSKSLGLWTSRVFSRANLPVFIVMFLISTYGTITAPYDDIVIRVGWYVEDWGKVAASAPQASSHDFLWTCAMAANVALSEVISGYLPNESRS